jgi:hypothetical protein
MAWVRYFEGRLDEAEELAGIVLPEVRERGDRWPLGMLIGLVAGIRLWRGDADEAARQAAEARQVFAAIDDQAGEVRSMLPLTRALAATGRIEEAKRMVEEVESLAPGLSEPAMRSIGSLVAASTAVYLGHGARALEAAERTEATFGRSSVEVEVLTGMSHLLLGHIDEALATLESVWSRAEGVGLRANAGSALALARAAGGMATDLDEPLAPIEEGGGTYLDRQLAAWARGFARARQGDAQGAREVLDGAVTDADATSDQVAQALSRLALAHLLAAAADPDAGSCEQAARDRLRALGLADTDWDRVFTIASAR